MRIRERLCFGFWLVGLSWLSMGAQGPEQLPAAQSGAVIKFTTKEVVLDLIVRDRRGRLVDDLKPDEVAVFEDGVPQKLNSFRFVGGPEQMEAEATAAKAEGSRTDAPHALNSLREMNYVSIVLAPMAGSNLDFARQAILQFFKDEPLPNTLVTIYRLDTRLRLVQPYTADVALLKRATEAATRAQPGHASSLASTALSTQASTAALDNAESASSRGGGNPLAQPSFSPNDPTFRSYAGTLDASASVGAAAQTQAELENRLRFVDNYVTGMTVADSLADLIRSQARLQGRKVVLYLSDGLVLPANRSDVFQQLISDANRAGVTFYTVDTRGLTITSPEASSVAALNKTTADRSLADAAQKGGLQGNASAAFDAASETEDLAKFAVSNTQLALQEVAVKTGGFATANTNEIGKPMRRVLEDIRTHYELAYTPSSDLYDGHFRKIEVKLARAKLVVQTRQGYYALPELNGEPVQSFEMASLNAISLRPAPANFAFQSDLLEYRPEGAAVQCQIALEVPVSSLSLEKDAKSDNARLRASLFALVQDGSGQVIHKLSRQLYRDVKTSDIDKVKDEKIEYAEPVALAPGHYRVSAVVTDENLHKTSVQRRSIYVAPVAEGHLGLSSVEIVKRVDPLAGPRDPSDPFEMANQRVTPTLADNISGAKPVPVYFVVYPAAGVVNVEPKLVVELSRDGNPVSRSAMVLPKPDATGSIPMVAELALKPGTYSLTLTAVQGTQAAQMTRSLTVE